MFPRRITRTKKPAEIVGASQLARDLGCTHLISAKKGSTGIYDAITRETHSLDGAASWQVTPYERGVDIAATGDEITFQNAIYSDTSNGAWFSLFIHYDIDSWEGANSGFLRSLSSGGGVDIILRNGTNGRPWIRWSGIDIAKPTTGQTLDVGEHTIIFCVKNNSGGSPLGEYRIYIDGVLTHSGTHSANASSQGFFQYGWQSVIGERIDGRTFTLAFFDRGISKGQARTLHETRGGVLFESRTQLLPLTVGVAPTFQAAWATNATTVQSLQGMS